MDKPFPILHTRRLTMVPLDETHLDALYCLFGDEEITRYTHIETFNAESSARRYLEWTRERFKEEIGIHWGITLKGHTELIGTICFNFYTPHERGNVGYDLLKAYWRQGYASEALYAVLCYGFQELNINRMEAEVMEGNLASARLLEKMGFQKEGLLRHWMYKEDRPYNVWVYSLLLSDILKAILSSGKKEKPLIN